LLKPNPWMADNASYVYVNPQNHAEKWSTFEEYKPVITMLYLATIDNTTPAIDGYTMETRLEHFVEELAQIGRAHNWDETRIKYAPDGNILLDADNNPATEEYDDLEGDKPSCFSGVKRRLFQSVQGHPLLKMLTKDLVTQDVHNFVREHFKSCITENNRQALIEAYDSFTMNGTASPEQIQSLQQLDITATIQNKLHKQMQEKYGPQFDKLFSLQLDNELKLNTYKGQAIDVCHAMKFAGKVDLRDLLVIPELVPEPLIEKELTPVNKSLLSSVGFFEAEVTKQYSLDKVVNNDVDLQLHDEDHLKPEDLNNNPK
jgi:hypothetical protein